MPILGSSNSKAKKDMMSKILIMGIQLSYLIENSLQNETSAIV